MSYLGVLVLVSLLIVVHEAGHLLAARWMGIPIAGFSVGFAWSRRASGGRSGLFQHPSSQAAAQPPALFSKSFRKRSTIAPGEVSSALSVLNAQAVATQSE